MHDSFIKRIFVITVAFILLFPNMIGIITGTSEKKDNEKNNKENYLNDIILNTSRYDNGRATSPWPMFRHDLNHTGRSQYNTSKNNGQKKWDFATGGYEASSPAIGSDGTIYFGCFDGKLYALFPNGTKKWDFTTGGSIHSSPTIGSNGTIFFGSSDMKLYALNPNGTKKWNFTTGGSVASSPAIGSDGTIYFGSGDFKLYALNPDGTEKWDFTTDGYIGSSPAIGSDGTIYFGSDDHRLYALYPDGTRKWDLITGGNVASSPAIGSDGTIYVGSDDHKLYAMNPNSIEKWEFAAGDTVKSSPAIDSDGTIYFGSWNHKLHALFPNGTRKWEFVLDIWETGFVKSSPAIGSDGTIYFGAGDGKLYAIGIYPLAPQKLTAIGGNAQVQLNWTAPSYDGGSAITNYIIYRGTTSGHETFLVKIGNVLTYQDKSVKNGQEYFYKVTAYNTFFESSRSTEASATPATTPKAPQNLTAAPGNAQIALNWIAPADNGGATITHFKIYRNDTVIGILGKVLTYNDSGLVNGVTYSYNISAMNRVGEGPKSIGVHAIPRTVPTAPYNLHATLGNAQIVLTWLEPASNGGESITNYSIYRGTTSDGETLYVRGYTSRTSWVDTNITPDTMYYYMVSAVNALGEGPRSNEAYTAPSAPTLTATAGNSKVLLSWTLPSSIGASITNYIVYRGTTSGGETLFIKAYNNGTSWVDTKITLGTTYYYMVSAVNGAGEGPNSNEQNATPYTVPSTPTLTVTAGNSKVTLSWTVPISNGAAITNYSIYRGTTSVGEILYVTGYTGGTSWVATNITVGTRYYYMVRAVNAGGEGPRSNEKNIIAGASPSVPTGLTASGGNAQVILRWSAPTSGGTPVQYNIYRFDSQTGTYTLIALPTTREYIDTGLTNGHKYWYKINAQNSYGVSGNTTAISATPHVTSIITVGSILLSFIIVIIVVLLIVEGTRSSRKKKA